MDPDPTPDANANAAVPPTTPVPPAPGSVPPAPGSVPPAPPRGAYPPGGYGPPGAYGTQPPLPRQYPAPIGWVIAAVIVFWPTAIPALLASHRSARAAGAGDVVTADREAASARRWGIVSVCVGGAIILLSLIATFVWALVIAVAVHDHRDGFGWDDRDGSSRIEPYGGPGVVPHRPGPGQMMPGMPGSGNGFGKGYGDGGGRGFAPPSPGQGGGPATPSPAPTASNG
ncbi:CD225/dispanin family protein [Cellulomonas alba]|uniref:CD225/dispanin family protein n=1 Tax=Cellulomonas alba TaxID=3053467 RepID=A0ABT7SFL7_9CELL|nr:CD225/dispanin family protein [Cellulomonas alba]MDM7854970.1 CD225/dispanin family protein [Cellulomonas alba]